MIRRTLRQVGWMAIATFLWQRRGSVVRAYDLARRLPLLVQTGRTRDALAEGRAILALDSRIPTRTDVRITGFDDGSLTLRGDVALDQLEDAREVLLGVRDVVDVRTSAERQVTLDDALAVGAG
jgi:hypothetical protein